MLKRSYQSPYQGNWNLPPERRPARAAWPGAGNSFLSRSPLRFRVSQPDRVMVHGYPGEDTECVVYLNQETLVEIVEERATGLANAEDPKGTEANRRILMGWEGRSTSSLMDEMK